MSRPAQFGVGRGLGDGPRERCCGGQTDGIGRHRCLELEGCLPGADLREEDALFLICLLAPYGSIVFHREASPGSGSSRKKFHSYRVIRVSLLADPTAEKLKSDVDILSVPFYVALYYIVIFTELTAIERASLAQSRRKSQSNDWPVSNWYFHSAHR
jgi:hypothetical protein